MIDFEENTDLSHVLFPIYFYLPIHQKYARSEGGYDSTTFDLVKQNSDYLRLGASWYYFTEETLLYLKVDQKELDLAKLYRGWNLISYAPQMFFNKLELGNCVVEKLYFWNPFLKTWILIDEEMLFGNNPEDNLVGYGFAIKVKDTCTLQKELSDKTLPAIPAIPQ